MSEQMLNAIIANLICSETLCHDCLMSFWAQDCPKDKPTINNKLFLAECIRKAVSNLDISSISKEELANLIITAAKECDRDE